MKWIALMVLLQVPAAFAGTRSDTEFSNIGGIANTRHNMTQQGISATTGGGAAAMDASRNNYGEVCVYCHTPHGSNQAAGIAGAPLWNRTFTNNGGAGYTTYDTLGTSSLQGTVTQPGVNSLTCLTCHDGTVAIDSIINMPGSGRYSKAQETAQNEAFLDSWTGDPFQDHGSLTTGGSFNCLACHTPSGPGQAQDFTVFALGTDLRDDHPVGITAPANDPVADAAVFAARDFKTGGGLKTVGNLMFYDADGDGRADSNELRWYRTDGTNYEVECASCHDPHGVPSAGAGTQHHPTFLRVSNTGSAVCLTCHDK